VQLKKANPKIIQISNKQSFVKYFKQNIWLYIFLIPGFVYLFIFNYVPMYGIIIAFKNFTPVKGIIGSPWIGLNNFEYLFKSKDFLSVLKNSIVLSILRMLWGFPAPILLAIMLNEVKNFKFKKGVQTIVYLPHFISWVVLAGMVSLFLAPSGGIVNKFIELLGGKPISFLTEVKYFRTILICTEIFKEIGWGTIIYLAAMTGIDPQLYEAAIIDGASRIQRIRYITIPGIATTIVVLLVLRMGSILRNGFEQVFLLQTPLVYSVSDIFETYTYRVGLLEGRFSYSTAVGLFQSVVGFIMITITNKLSKKINENSLW
jgi:putative aldouronate transport system permease protein